MCLLPLLLTVGCQFTQDLGGPDPAALQGAGAGGVGGGSSSSTTGAGASVEARLPLEDLQFPMGLWVRDGKVYFTEAAKTGTSFGGIARLSVYDPATSTRTTLVDDPVNYDCVAVASDGKIYLAGWAGSIPGDSGHISVVDPVTLVESPVADLDAAAGDDMFMDDQDNLYVTGAGVDGTTTGIYLLAAGDYEHPIRFRGLSTTSFTASGDTFYLNGWGISRFTGQGALEKDWVADDPSWWAVSGLTVHAGRLFYGGYGCSDGYVPGYGQCPPLPVGEIRSVDLSSGGAYTTVAAGLGKVANVRVDSATGRLYVLEYGSGDYKNGRLLAVDPPP
jgi:hypothetical protein